MSREPFVLETPAQRGCQLRVRFDWLGDRYGHSIEFLESRHWVPVLKSMEGLASEEWPPSPALQQLHAETRDGAPVALLVGMAGKSYWSMSVEYHRDTNALSFDVACKVSSRSNQLNSSYEMPAAGHAKIEGDRLIYEDGNRIGLSMTVSVPSVAKLQLDRRIVTVVPSSNEASVRWKYNVACFYK